MVKREPMDRARPMSQDPLVLPVHQEPQDPLETMGQEGRDLPAHLDLPVLPEVLDKLDPTERLVNPVQMELLAVMLPTVLVLRGP